MTSQYLDMGYMGLHLCNFLGHIVRGGHICAFFCHQLIKEKTLLCLKYQKKYLKNPYSIFQKDSNY